MDRFPGLLILHIQTRANTFCKGQLKDSGYSDGLRTIDELKKNSIRNSSYNRGYVAFCLQKHGNAIKIRYKRITGTFSESNKLVRNFGEGNFDECATSYKSSTKERDI